MVNSLSPSLRRVVVLGTGGTIAGRAASGGDNIGYTAGQVAVADLLGDIDAPEGVVLEAEQVAQLDSKDMGFDVWLQLARRCALFLSDPDVAGVVITHGTDTIEETAFFLQAVLATGKPVVLTCAMRPASSLSPDGPQNVRDAIAVAATPGAQGVTVVCAGSIHGALDVQKVHTYRPDAFSSGDAGPVGYVEEGDVRLLRTWPSSPASGPSKILAMKAGEALRWPRVEIVTSHAGASGAIVDLLLQERAAGVAEPVRGLVLAATGNGTVHYALEAAALRAQDAGVAVLRATRCANGRILPKADDRLRDAGALTPVKARIALMLELL
ncbi:L-asparaginase [Variovorax sp. Root318D1]|uniref:asparaginase n=1 Tax=Variovorax sp. Root318D1 TaxID=1736513 RepID=UPI0007008A38|nr:asparaginase [Variovorax sp. Root318D1]KQU90159.1 L-asparaginase [Variovorax sp. Root318D1]